MSNFDRAVKTLNDVNEAIGHLADNEAYVTALEATGLLAPDLPEPDNHDEENTYWHEGTFQVGTSAKFGKAQVAFTDSEPGGVLYTDIESARDYALKILAACEYAEKMVHDE